MRFFIFGICLFLSNLLSAADKKPAGPARGGNDVLDITASVYVDKGDVIGLLGRDPAMNLIVVKVQLTPKADNKVQVWRDDFTLLLSRDGQKSQPLEPGQIAGRGGMVIKSQGTGGISGGKGRTSIGIPGLGTGGGGGVGVGTAGPGTETTATTKTGADEPDNPLLQILKDKILPETESNEPSSGLLYFILDGKPPKTKDLSLIYRFHGGRVVLDFKP